MKPVYIVDIIGEVVAATCAAILPTIQGCESQALGRTAIETVNYQKGHKIELIQTLQEMDRDSQSQGKRYPLIYLVQDFTERRGRDVGIYAEVRLNVILMHYTESTRKVDDRYAKVFKPVLYPLYYEFLKQLALHPMINTEIGGEDIEHDKTDRLFWGTKPAGGPDGKLQLTDFLDAIEISNLNLKFYFKTC